MGAGNVKLVFARWGHLNDRPFRVLAYMALTSLDRDDTPRYFGGWESLAWQALGRRVPDVVDDDTAREHDAIKKAVSRAVAELRKAGAIDLLNRPQIGDRGDYALRLDPPSASSTGGRSPSTTTTQEGDTHRPPEGDTERPPRGGRSVEKEGDTHRPPKEEPTGGLQDIDHDQHPPNVTTLNRARARAAARDAAAARL